MTAASSLPLAALRALERLRGSSVVVYWAAEPAGMRVQAADIPILYKCLRGSGRVSRRDVILNTEGGLLTAARRMALLLREYSERLDFLVPYRARSAGTLLCLAGDSMVLGPLGELGPLDPILRTGKKASPDAPSGISAEDLRMFRVMMKKWFGLASATDRMRAFEHINARIFPTTLSSIFRADQYVRMIATELLAFQLPAASRKQRDALVDRLISGYHEHQHQLTCSELQALGLRASAASPEEEEQLFAIMEGCTSFLEGQQGAAMGVLFSSRFAASYIAHAQDSDAPSADAQGARRNVLESGRWNIIAH